MVSDACYIAGNSNFFQFTTIRECKISNRCHTVWDNHICQSSAICKCRINYSCGSVGNSYRNGRAIHIVSPAGGCNGSERCAFAECIGTKAFCYSCGNCNACQSTAAIKGIVIYVSDRRRYFYVCNFTTTIKSRFSYTRDSRLYCYILKTTATFECGIRDFCHTCWNRDFC